MYFVHSHYVIPSCPEIKVATTDYGIKYCSAIIQTDNIFATQFHPEKSGLGGLKIYKSLKEKIEREN